jgi:ribosomal protein S18 acetylase RimI-like enzyme
MDPIPVPIRVAKHPFESPEGHVLIDALNAELDALYPDWDELVHPGRDDKVEIAESRPSDDSDNLDTKSITFLIAFASPSHESPTGASDSDPNSNLAGCIAIVPLPTDPIEGLVLPAGARAAEIKRVYVAPAFRKRGVSQALLLAAEAEARAQGFSVLTLETGIRQIGAIKLYERNNWSRCPTYGIYIESREEVGGVSICYRKDFNSD